MRKFLFGLIIGFLIISGYWWFAGEKDRKNSLEESTAFIQQEISNVSKLIVTEGHFSQVYNYKQSEGFFGNLWVTEKKALVVVNAEVQIVYDLSRLKVEIDSENKTLHIREVPPPEVKIFSDFEYYDAKGDYFNPFDADDFNRVKSRVETSIKRKIEQSNLKESSEKRLIAELTRFYVLTNSLGWKLVYNQKEVLDEDGFELREVH